MKNTILNWSGGKDCVMALYRLLQENKYWPVKFLTTINHVNSNVPMHEVHESLVAKQAKSCGFELERLYLPEAVSNKVYEKMMKRFWKKEKEAGNRVAAFGDIFLEDVKEYRENHLRPMGIETIFPLWKSNTHLLIKEFLNLGFKAIITAADARFFGEDIPGTTLDENFVRSLPDGVDPCGENGEFHTFVYDGPVFSRCVEFKKGVKGFTAFDEKGSGAWNLGLLPVD